MKEWINLIPRFRMVIRTRLIRFSRKRKKEREIDIKNDEDRWTDDLICSTTTMNSDRSSSVSSSLSLALSRQGRSTNVDQVCSSQNKIFKSPLNQFYCNLCFCPLIQPQNINRASFVTSCGHFYCEQCAQTSKFIVHTHAMFMSSYWWSFSFSRFNAYV